jgi:hypothetical protein
MVERLTLHSVGIWLSRLSESKQDRAKVEDTGAGNFGVFVRFLHHRSASNVPARTSPVVEGRRREHLWSPSRGIVLQLLTQKNGFLS